MIIGLSAAIQQATLIHRAKPRSGACSYLANQAASVGKSLDQAAGVAGTFVLTGGAIVSMDSASGLELAGAAGGGLGTGFKAVGNGAATGVVNTVTLGFHKGAVELFSVTDADRAIGFLEVCLAGFAQTGTELLTGTLGPGAASAVAKGTRFASAVGKGVLAFDAAGNAVGVGNGAIDIAENGLTLQNTIQVVASGAGLAGNAAAAKNLIGRAPNKVQQFPDKTTARGALSGDQQAAANRFFKGATSKSGNFKATDLEGGGKRLEFFSPANNPGFGKRYVQDIDVNAAVIQEFKETYGPDGLLETKWITGGPG